eukprot:jgi/Botrbrau1/2762/Bobra.0164s0040.1
MGTRDADARGFLSEDLAAPPETALDFVQASTNSGLVVAQAGPEGYPEQRTNNLEQTTPDGLPGPDILQVPPADGGLLQLLQGGSADEGETSVDLCALPPPPAPLLFGQGTQVETVAELPVDSVDIEGASLDTGADPALLQEGQPANSQFQADGSVPPPTSDAPAGPSDEDQPQLAASAEAPASPEKRKRGRPKGSKNRPKEERQASLLQRSPRAAGQVPAPPAPLAPPVGFNWGSGAVNTPVSFFTNMGPLGTLLAQSLAQQQQAPALPPPMPTGGSPESLPRKRGRPRKSAPPVAALPQPVPNLPVPNLPVPNPAQMSSASFEAPALEGLSKAAPNTSADEEIDAPSSERDEHGGVPALPASPHEVPGEASEAAPPPSTEQREQDLLDKYGANVLERYPILREQFSPAVPANPAQGPAPDVPPTGRRRGRPVGSKNKPKQPPEAKEGGEEPQQPRKRGRPPGSKNKVRVRVESQAVVSTPLAVATLPFPFNVPNPFMFQAPTAEAMSPALVAALATQALANPGITATYASIAAAAALQTQQQASAPDLGSPPPKKRGRPPGSKKRVTPAQPAEPPAVPSDAPGVDLGDGAVGLPLGMAADAATSEWPFAGFEDAAHSAAEALPPGDAALSELQLTEPLLVPPVDVGEYGPSYPVLMLPPQVAPLPGAGIIPGLPIAGRKYPP